MLRIHFTAEDLVRTRLSPGWGPLAETYFSLTRLRRHDRRDILDGWSARVGRRSRGLVHPCATLFDGGHLDLFTLTGPAGTVEEGLAALLDARPAHVAAELSAAVEVAGRYGDRPRWPAVAGDPAWNAVDRRRLVGFLRDYHRVAVAPYWSRIQTRLAAEQRGYAHVLAAGGVDGLLAALAPLARWRPPVLEVGRGPRTEEMTLGGRGLVLVPSVYYGTGPAVWVGGVDDTAPAVLFFPVLRGVADVAATFTSPAAVDRLAALANVLGRTRAYALDAIGAGPCTTGELARRLRVSPASASEHATVLREAGLVATTRHGSTVRHALTVLGERLLDGAVPVVPGRAQAAAGGGCGATAGAAAP